MIDEERESSHRLEIETRFVRSRRTWKKKFQDAFAGLRQSVQQQSSYRVHFIFAVSVIVLGVVMRLDATRWSLLVLCITVVLAGEMLNTSIETLSRAVTERYDERVRRSLDIAGGAVLVLSTGAAIVGLILFIEAGIRIFL